MRLLRISPLFYLLPAASLFLWSCPGDESPLTSDTCGGSGQFCCDTAELIAEAGTDSDGCRSDLSCNTSTGRCTSTSTTTTCNIAGALCCNGVSCTGDLDCNTSTGRCERPTDCDVTGAECCSGDVCRDTGTIDLECNTTTNRCVREGTTSVGTDPGDLGQPCNNIGEIAQQALRGIFGDDSESHPCSDARAVCQRPFDATSGATTGSGRELQAICCIPFGGPVSLSEAEYCCEGAGAYKANSSGSSQGTCGTSQQTPDNQIAECGYEDGACCDFSDNINLSYVCPEKINQDLICDDTSNTCKTCGAEDQMCCEDDTCRDGFSCTEESSGSPKVCRQNQSEEEEGEEAENETDEEGEEGSENEDGEGTVTVNSDGVASCASRNGCLDCIDFESSCGWTGTSCVEVNPVTRAPSSGNLSYNPNTRSIVLHRMDCGGASELPETTDAPTPAVVPENPSSGADVVSRSVTCGDGEAKPETNECFVQSGTPWCEVDCPPSLGQNFEHGDCSPQLLAELKKSSVDRFGKPFCGSSIDSSLLPSSEAIFQHLIWRCWDKGDGTYGLVSSNCRVKAGDLEKPNSANWTCANNACAAP